MGSDSWAWQIAWSSDGGEALEQSCAGSGRAPAAIEGRKPRGGMIARTLFNRYVDVYEERRFWMAVDSADSWRYFYLNTDVSVTNYVRRNWSIWQRSQVMLWGSISLLLWKGLEIVSRATMGLYLIFALKQQYKNNRLLTGGREGGRGGWCRHLSFSPHVACAAGAPRSFRLHRHRSAASCTLCAAVVDGASTGSKGSNTEEVGGGGPEVTCWCQTQKNHPKKIISHITAVLSSLPTTRIL